MRRPLQILLAVAALALLAVGWFVWRCQHDSRIPFLPAHGTAAWIVYPTPPDAKLREAFWFPAVFRREFTLASTPAQATLELCAFRGGNVFVNRQSVSNLNLSPGDWKKSHAADVTALLRPGTNELTVVVSNAYGPPALWLQLDTGTMRLASDETWQVSLAGAAWQPARHADSVALIRPGNPIAGCESISESFRGNWPTWAMILLLAATGAWLLERQAQKRHETFIAIRPPGLILLAVVAVWLALFTNNIPQLAMYFGFDSESHLEYLNHLLTKHTLPRADQGWEMYQPPLYYLVAASWLAPFGLKGGDPAAWHILRSFSALCGLANVALIFLCLRRLFPRDEFQRIAGLLIAAWLPAHLVVAHHITNETLAALLVTAGFYCAVRLLTGETSPARWQTATGFFLGLALLAKVSALIAVPVVVVAVAWCVWQQTSGQRRIRELSLLLARLGIPLLLLCGWHYFRVWREFGNPLIGNWDERLGFAWWQDPGYATVKWFFRFGAVLLHPAFSGMNGFADGFYSTLWGDGLGSGVSGLMARPAWNWNVMNFAYWLALPLSAAALVGLLGVARRIGRAADPKAILIGGIATAYAAGVIYMAVRVPSHAQSKAFYALPALLPFAALVAAGLGWLRNRGGFARFVTAWLLLSWTLAVLATFWIRPGNAAVPLTRAVQLLERKKDYAAAAKCYEAALQIDPHNEIAAVGLIEAWMHLERTNEAFALAADTVRAHPSSADARHMLAGALTRQGDNVAALAELNQAIGLAPDKLELYPLQARLLGDQGKLSAAMESAREALRIDPTDANARYQFGVMLAQQGRHENAQREFELATHFDPDYAEAHNNLGIELAVQGDFNGAIRHQNQALRLKPDYAEAHNNIAFALARLGRRTEAIRHLREALRINPGYVTAQKQLMELEVTTP